MSVVSLVSAVPRDAVGRHREGRAKAKAVVGHESSGAGDAVAELLGGLMRARQAGRDRGGGASTMASCVIQLLLKHTH